MSAFLRLGRPLDLIGLIFGGVLRRMREVGVAPWSVVVPGLG